VDAISCESFTSALLCYAYPQASACTQNTADAESALHTKLTLDWRTGVAATDWDTIAKKEHLDQLSVEMRKVEGAIREIYAEMLQLQQREQEMRDLNGAAPTGQLLAGWGRERRDAGRGIRAYPGTPALLRGGFFDCLGYARCSTAAVSVWHSVPTLRACPPPMLRRGNQHARCLV
jgi:emp24/gp25L/p24 family/GOLD